MIKTCITAKLATFFRFIDENQRNIVVIIEDIIIKCKY